MVRRNARSMSSLAFMGILGLGTPGLAQTAEEVQAARLLFTDAVQDEGQGRYDIALDKYRRVQSVKDTAAVRYRIATCLDAKGRLEEAASEYDLAIAKADPTQRELATTSAQKAASARLRMPQLTIKLAEPALETEVRLDGQPVPQRFMGVGRKVNPGRHVVDADAKGRPHFHLELNAHEASTLEANIAFAKSGRTGETDSPATTEPGGTTGQRTGGFASLAAGAGVAVLGLVFVGVANAQISSIRNSCPDDVCPASMRDSITSKQSSARTFMPMGFTLVGVGAAAAIVGATLLLTLPKERTASAIVFPTDGGLGAGWVGRF